MHYELGWVQVNDTHGNDRLNPHVDQAGWGDVIVVFTTMAVNLQLGSGNKTPAEISGTDASFPVPAGSAYVLSGFSRRFAEHTAKLPEGRIGVVLRYYLKDLCELGIRGLKLKQVHYVMSPSQRRKAMEFWRKQINNECVARWPQEGTKLGCVAERYPSVYPGRIARVEEQNNICVVYVAFFLDDEGIRGDLEALQPEIAPVAVPCWMVLDVDASTRWFNDFRDLTARQFHEVLHDSQRLYPRAAPIPPPTRNPIVAEEDIVRSRPQRQFNKTIMFDATILTMPCYPRSLPEEPSPRTRRLRYPGQHRPKNRDQPPKKKKKKATRPLEFDDLDDRPSLDDDGITPKQRKKRPKKKSPAKKIPPPPPPAPLKPPYDQYDMERRTAAFLKATMKEFPGRSLIGVPDVCWDSPALLVFFNDNRRRLPEKSQLVNLAKFHYNRLQDIYCSRYDDDIKPLLDLYNSSSRISRRAPRT